MSPRTRPGRVGRGRGWTGCFLACVGIGLGLGRALAAEDRLVADFEGMDHGDWTVTGTAFGRGPASGTLPGQGNVGGFRGRGWANSGHGGDVATGTLTSPELPVTHRYLNFLIGGGAHRGRTCLNVLVDGRVVASARGRDDEFLNMATLDLGGYLGRRLRIQIVDEATGEWGHIHVDHLVLSDAAATPPVAGDR